jgi:hypothetical protein
MAIKAFAILTLVLALHIFDGMTATISKRSRPTVAYPHSVFSLMRKIVSTPLFGMGSHIRCGVFPYFLGVALAPSLGIEPCLFWLGVTIGSVLAVPDTMVLTVTITTPADKTARITRVRREEFNRRRFLLAALSASLQVSHHRSSGRWRRLYKSSPQHRSYLSKPDSRTRSRSASGCRGCRPWWSWRPRRWSPRRP